jgi:threonine synthase
MRYISTRGLSPPVSFVEAVLAGMAPDGGLYVPEEWPQLPESFCARASLGHHSGIALAVLMTFAGEELDARQWAAICSEAYLGFPERPDWRPHWPEMVTPLVQVGIGDFIMELFHGPSLSFKDVAMQLIGPLFDHLLTQREQRLSVVCATSGDTGGAAVEALKGRARADLFVLLPKGRVSEVQRRFMTTSGAENVHTIEIDGDFDACQAIVKSLFADRDFAARAQLSGVNSINWARIAAQSVYYFIAASALSGPGPVNAVVPTGNFGDAYSGWAAKQMGARIGKIVLATNSNDILTRALQTGRYERAAHSQATVSPAMDIQVASNFERILFEALDRDGAAVRALFEQFAQSGGFNIPETALARLRNDFAAASVDDAETLRTMSWQMYAPCPHTAVALWARTKLAEPLQGPVVTLATAHPAKFPAACLQATGVRPPLPLHCADLYERTETFDTLPADAEAVKRYIRERTRAWV